MYDPASHTFDLGMDNRRRFHKSFLATIAVILLAPVILVYKGCEKLEEWQNDRNYAFQKEVLKQGPIAVLVTQEGAEDGDKVQTMVKGHKFRSLVDQGKVQVVEPTVSLKEGLPQPKWVILCTDQDKEADYACARYLDGTVGWDDPKKLEKWQPMGWGIVFGFFDGPGAWEKAQQALPCLEKVEVEPQYRAKNGHPEYKGKNFDLLFTCWYDYGGKTYAYQRRILESDPQIGFWREQDLLSLMQQAKGR